MKGHLSKIPERTQRYVTASPEVLSISCQIVGRSRDPCCEPFLLPPPSSGLMPLAPGAIHLVLHAVAVDIQTNEC